MINQTVVSRESLHALATLALATIKIDANSPAKPEFNLGESITGALRNIIRKKYRPVESEEWCSYIDAHGLGVELGLDIAAAILSNGLDAKTTSEAVKSAIDQISQCWPEELFQPKEAA
jgi:hypothetical protein